MTVVDASVAVKWFAMEDHSEQAARLLADSGRQGSRLVGPKLLPFEVANAIMWQQRRGLLPAEEAENATIDFPGRRVEIVRTEHLIPAAMRFAQAHKLPAIYDAIYVVLARELDAEFWTADERLLRAVADQAPWVRWIGSYR